MVSLNIQILFHCNLQGKEAVKLSQAKNVRPNFQPSYIWHVLSLLGARRKQKCTDIFESGKISSSVVERNITISVLMAS